MCLNYMTDKTGEVVCVVFIWTMNIYTQLNVYIWMYLSRTVFRILVKSSVGKQGRKCLPFMLTIWSPPHSPLLYRHQKLHTCHTHRQTRTHVHKVIKCPTHNIPETIFKLLSVNKQTPTYSSDKTDANMDFCSQWMLSPVIFQAACHLMSFMNDANNAYQLIPTSIKYFTNAPGCHHLLQVKPWKPC